MARYSRRRPYRRPYSVSFRFGRNRRGFKRQNAGALQQRDVGRFIVKDGGAGSLTIDPGSQSNIQTFNMLQILQNTNMFTNLKKVFDQVKLNAIKVKLVPTAVQTPANAYMQSVMSWDRTGVDQTEFGKAITYGSAKTNYFATGTKTTITHYIGAETIGEKTQYLASGDLLSNDFAWKPFLIFGICAPAQVAAGQVYTMSYSVEWTFDCTFRGTRLQ